MKSEEDSVGIRTKASLALVETLMRVQIHYWLINHDTRDMEGGRKGGEAEQEGGEGGKSGLNADWRNKEGEMRVRRKALKLL